ncbi:hypothetical protein [Actinomyces minihominis]|uniref:hypothetical protein n=1 Tax=Actinomyces minihominis TaxID=2002838 RepID=UPI000C0794EE|nr:hypothetical protein [Actinomyces minihominis]
MPPDDCPSWCSREHEDFSSGELEPAFGDDFSDYIHSTRQAPVPAVTLRKWGVGAATVENEVLEVVLFQYQFHQGSPGPDIAQEEWVFIGGDENAFTLTRESAKRLYRQLGTVLAY